MLQLSCICDIIRTEKYFRKTDALQSILRNTIRIPINSCHNKSRPIYEVYQQKAGSISLNPLRHPINGIYQRNVMHDKMM